MPCRLFIAKSLPITCTNVDLLSNWFIENSLGEILNQNDFWGLYSLICGNFNPGMDK